MINPHRVAELLSNLISEKLSLYDHATVNHTRDEEVAEHFYGQVESILESTHYSFQTKDTIDFNDNSNTKQFEDEEAEEEEEEEEEEEINNDDERFDETFMEYIERFRKYLESGGTKQQKLDKIDQYTYEKFEKARSRSEFLFIHDIHLKKWALQKAREINDNTFKASDSWIFHFKRRHALCSRKVTKLIT
ncbi:unnamed protein product [Rotaria sp. Silwood1]|nr:unnamed protein product [Rotaria sp. Silwood1]